MMLTLSGSLGGATCQEITPSPNLRKGVSQAPGGRVPKGHPSPLTASPSPSPSRLSG